jgi:hypothetical protein
VGEPKIVITGTGRAGTTLLVQILTELGLDTGFDEGRLTPILYRARAGLECRVDDPDAPTFVKDMTLGFRMREILESGDHPIRHVILPTRELDVAVASRVRTADYGRRPFGKGALTGTLHATRQKRVLQRMRNEIIGALDEFGIPYTTLEFPRFATDAAYTYEALSRFAPDATLADFEAALGKHVRADLIHETSLSSRERWRTRATTAWMTVVRYPIAAVRRRIDPEGTEERIRASVKAARARDEAAAQRELEARSHG